MAIRYEVGSWIKEGRKVSIDDGSDRSDSAGLLIGMDPELLMPKRRRRTPKTYADRRPGLPSGIRLFGERHPIRSFRDILLVTAKQLWQGGHDLDLACAHWRGTQGRTYMSRSGAQLREAQRVGSSSFYIEVNHNATDCITRSKELIRFYGYPASALELIYEEEDA